MEHEISSLKQNISSMKNDLYSMPRPPVYDCAELLREGHTVSGVYNIYLHGARKYIKVFCDMTTDGGGWLMRNGRNLSLFATGTHKE
ncbi:hypothetical protein LSAT2_002376 [Lamellibrachia satsuma]|nr:hypothetical protein LSAT2_002376 [Lamellibrachia satsuma]